jgi:hypothetical protein
MANGRWYHKTTTRYTTCRTCGGPLPPKSHPMQFCSQSCANQFRTNSAQDVIYLLTQSKVRRVESGCLEWMGKINSYGYGKVYYGGREMFAHRLSYQMVVGNIPVGQMVCHKCDNRRCVEPSHLFLGTAKDNQQDASQKGRLRHTRHFGEGNPNAKLTITQVEELRRRYELKNPGDTLFVIGRDYGITYSGVRRIVKGQTWRMRHISRNRLWETGRLGENAMTEQEFQHRRQQYAMELQRRYGITPGVTLQVLRPKAHCGRSRGDDVIVHPAPTDASTGVCVRLAWHGEAW